MSLRLRLTLLNGLVLLVALGLFASVSYVSQARSLQSNLDVSLREDARRFRELPPFWLERGFDRTGDSAASQPRRLPTTPGRIFQDPLLQITDGDGTVHLRSRSLDERTLPVTPEMLQRALAGEEWLTDGELDGQPVRLIVAPVGVGRPGAGRSPAGMVEIARPLAPMYASLGTLQTTFLTVGAVGILASVLGGWLLARAALRPIDWLAATAHAIGAAQDFGRRVPTRPGRRRDEVGRLADELNGMLARLQAAHDQIEAALGAQRRFIADASHELRTPLTSIRGNIDLLQTLVAEGRSVDDVDEQERILAEAAAEIERLGRLVNDLLLLAQADAGQHIALAPTRLDTVIHEAFRSARFLREGVALQIGPLPSDVWVEGHPDRLKQLFLILLDNGLKYTPRGGRVTIGGEEQVRAGAPGLAIQVADTGPGIPPGEREKVFDRFYRADPARTAGGAGLGLAIARWIVEEHGGTIGVESTSEAGSVFTVWLPTIGAPAELPAPIVPVNAAKRIGSSPTAMGEE